MIFKEGKKLSKKDFKKEIELQEFVQNNLKETFDNMTNLININDMKNEKLKEILT